MKKHIDYLLDIVGPKSGGGGGYPEPTGTIEITQNGTYDVKDKAEAQVAVGPQFPVIMQITQNGRYDVVDYTGVDVNVAGPSGSTTITENGTYDVTDKAQAVVNVPSQDKSVGLVDGTATHYESSDVLSVRNLAFNYNSALQSVSLPNATAVGNSAFNMCSALTALNLPKMTQAGSYSFRDTKIENIDFPLLGSVGSNCFGNSWALSGGPFLKTVKLPSYTGPAASVTTPQVFYQQTKLETVDFGTGVVSNYMAIGAQDFYGCSSLKAVIIRYDRVATLRNANAFQNTPIASGTGYIYVPSALIASYQAATNWATYSAQFRALEDYTADDTTTGELDPTKI